MMIALLGASLLLALGLGFGWERTRRLPGSVLWWARGLLLLAAFAGFLILAGTAVFVKVRSAPPAPAPIDTTYQRDA